MRLTGPTPAEFDVGALALSRSSVSRTGRNSSATTRLVELLRAGMRVTLLPRRYGGKVGVSRRPKRPTDRTGWRGSKLPVDRRLALSPSGPGLTDGTHLRRLAPRHSGHGGGNQALDPIH